MAAALSSALIAREQREGERNEGKGVEKFCLVLIREPFYGTAHFFAHFSNKNQLNSYACAGKRGRGSGRGGNQFLSVCLCVLFLC